MGNEGLPIFDNQDNPLRKEFLTIDQIVDFFRPYGERWVRQQMAVGNLPYKRFGRDGIRFYLPEVRQAILEERLAPIQRKKVQYDTRKETSKRHSLRSTRQVQGASSLKELRHLQGRNSLD